MSNFKPHLPMPYDLKEFQAKILENRGLHYNFPYGYKPSIKKDARFIVSLKEFYFPGLTVRGFFYAPGPDKVEFEVRYENTWWNYYYYAMAQIDSTDVRFSYDGEYTGDKGLNKYTPYKINAPGYYSIAVRIESDKHLSARYKDIELKTVQVGTLKGYDFELRIIGNSHYLVSLHSSDEWEANTHFPSTYFGQSYYFSSPALGISSYWIMDCIVNNKDLPLEVHIAGEDKGAVFSLKNEKRGDEVTIYIRSVVGGWQVTTSFQDTSVYIKHKSANHQNYIYPSISTNCNILTQHAEQGLQRY